MKLKFTGVTGEAGTQSQSSHPAQMEEHSKISAAAKEQRAADINLLEIGRAYNKNMLIMGRTPEYLYKGMKEGKSIEELFMIAVRGVAACLSDPMLEKVMARGLAERKEKSKEVNEME